MSFPAKRSNRYSSPVLKSAVSRYEEPSRRMKPKRLRRRCFRTPLLSASSPSLLAKRSIEFSLAFLR